MNFYSDYHTDGTRRGSRQDIFWESSSHNGLLSTKEPYMMVPMRHEFIPSFVGQKRQNQRSTCFSCKSCLLGSFIAIFVIGLTVALLYFYNYHYLSQELTFINSTIKSAIPIQNLRASGPSTVTSKIPSVFSMKSLTTKQTKEFLTSSTSKNLTTCNKRIVGYYKGWGTQVISENQLKKLTHVIFKYVIINKNGTLSFKNNLEEMKFLDLKNKTKSRNSGVKLMISIENASELEFSVHGEMRKNIINSIASFITKHKLDGVDIDWRHPRPEEIPDQVIFIKELRSKLSEKSKSQIISIAASAKEWDYKYRMKLAELLEYVDFINIFSFDYYPSSGNLTGPPAPLFSGIEGYRGYNVDRTMKYFYCETKNSRKLNMGIPFYGQYWKNVKGPINGSEEFDDMWRNVESKNGSTGYIPWNSLQSNGWNIKKYSWNRNAMTPFIWNPKREMFLGFENQKSLEKKMDYAKKKNIGGVMIESIGDDDDENTLLNVISENNQCSENYNTDPYKCYSKN